MFDDPVTITALLGCCIAIGCALRMSYRLGQTKQEMHTAHAQSAQYREDVARQRVNLLDAIADSVLLVQQNGRVVLANRRSKQLFRTPDLEGRDLSTVVLDPQMAEVIGAGLADDSPTRRAVKLSGNATRELVPDHANGETAWEIDISPLVGYENDVSHRILIRDVTRSHQAEQVRKDFVANASHELRTPLAIIRGYLENLLEPDGMDEPNVARHQLEVMDKHSDRISRIVEDMLLISRLESGAVTAISPSEFSLAECFADISERVESLVRSASAKFTTHVDPADATLVADPFYITQVLFNLVENAIKQNPDREVAVRLAAKREPDQMRITVFDNGSGIPSADLQHIFRRFYRVQKDHSQNKIKGTGLGLSIVKRAVEAHDGQVSVTSRPGVDTTFTILLPLQ